MVWCVHGPLHTRSGRHPFTVLVFRVNVCTPAFSCELMRGAIINAVWRHPFLTGVMPPGCSCPRRGLALRLRWRWPSNNMYWQYALVRALVLGFVACCGKSRPQYWSAWRYAFLNDPSTPQGWRVIRTRTYHITRARKLRLPDRETVAAWCDTRVL